MSTREIVTLQFGHYSNFVGTHWWNIQESSFVYDPKLEPGTNDVNHDVLFREGENRQKQVTFTPRLVTFDLKGSLNSLRQEGSLYEAGGDDDIRWTGDVTMHSEETARKNRFLTNLEKEDGKEYDEVSMATEDDDDTKESEMSEKETASTSQATHDTSGVFGPKLYNLENTVKVWSDFLRTQYHPKTVHIIEEYRHGDTLNPFDLFSCNSDVLSNYTSTCEWEDRLHYFTEECDNLQGFHVIMDTHDGFGGFGSSVLSYLADEYPGKGILTFGATPANLPDATAHARASRIINSALAFDKGCEHSSLFVPMSLAKGLWRVLEPIHEFPDLTYQSTPYHTSAILAATLDTVSLPYRLRSNAMHMRDITHSFNAQGRAMAGMCTSLPLPFGRSGSLIDLLASHTDTFPWQSVTPHFKSSEIPLMQSVVSRGIGNDLVKTKQAEKLLPRHFSGIDTIDGCLNSYLSHRCEGNLFATSSIESPLKTVSPFPHIFQDQVGKDGFLSSTMRPAKQGVTSVPMLTSLQCTREVGGVILRLYEAASKMNIKKHHKYMELGLEEDDYVEVLDSLRSLASNYNTETEGL